MLTSSVIPCDFDGGGLGGGRCSECHPNGKWTGHRRTALANPVLDSSPGPETIASVVSHTHRRPSSEYGSSLSTVWLSTSIPFSSFGSHRRGKSRSMRE